MKNKFIANITKMLKYIGVVAVGVAAVLTYDTKEARAELVNLVMETSAGTATHQTRLVTLYIDGQRLAAVNPALDMPPVIFQDRTLVPVRHVFEAMGAIVDFHPAEQRILIVYDNQLIVMYVGSYDFSFGDRVYHMDVAPHIINSRTMVPVSFVASAMGFEVDWEPTTATVYLDRPQNGDVYNGVYNGMQSKTQNNTQNNPTSAPNLPTVNRPSTSNNANIDFAQLSRDATVFQPIIEDHPIATINNITWNDNQSQFTISATSPISAVQWHMYPDGRLRVDIMNGTANFPRSIFGVNNHFLTNIRTGQNIIDDIPVARAVFDLSNPIVYSVAISADRLSVVVTVAQNDINHVTLVNTYMQNGRESVIITGREVMPDGDIFFLPNPDRLVVDLPHSALTSLLGVVASNSHFATEVRVAQFSQDTVRVVIELARDASFEIERDLANATLMVHLSEPTHRNIDFNNTTNTIEITRSATLDWSQVKHFDDYLNRRHYLTLPFDFSEFFGYGSFRVLSNSLRYIDIITHEGATTFVLTTNSIYVLVVSETTTGINIRLANPREIHPFVVIIDPGHGGADPGAMHRTPGSPYYGMRESNVVLKISLLVIDILRCDGIVQVYTTRYDDSTVSLNQRVAMANAIGDIFVSIHTNASIGVGATATGTETLYAIHPNEGDFNSRNLAQIFQRNLVEDLGRNNRGLLYRPRTVVLNSTIIPSILLEIEFTDSIGGASFLAQPENLLAAAESIVRSIYETMGVFAPPR